MAGGCRATPAESRRRGGGSSEGPSSASSEKWHSLQPDNTPDWRSIDIPPSSSACSASGFWDSDDEGDGKRPADLYGKFTWKIETFSEISKRELRSNIFEVGGYKWYILVYPQGCDVCNHLSLFLCVADYDKLLPGWNHFAQFTIAVVNKDPKKSKYSDTLHRFCKKEHDWGWKKFMELSKVLDGFTVADTLVIKAQVQVIRENPRRPFRCLDCQYRRELVRVYLTNVESICRRFVEEKREKLGKLLEDRVRWNSLRAFWNSVDERARRQQVQEKCEVILRAVVKRFFNDKEVTSTLVMDALYGGCKELHLRQLGQGQGQGDAEGATGGRHGQLALVRVDNDSFVLAGDALSMLERAATEPMPLYKDDKGPPMRSKEGGGDDGGKEAVERDECRLAELGRRTIEMFVLTHLYSNRVEVAYREAVALRRQEELIREEEAAELASQEQRARREQADRDRRAKKKQAKQRKKDKKEKEKEKEEEEKRAKLEEVHRSSSSSSSSRKKPLPPYAPFDHHASTPSASSASSRAGLGADTPRLAAQLATERLEAEGLEIEEDQDLEEDAEDVGEGEDIEGVEEDEYDHELALGEGEGELVEDIDEGGEVLREPAAGEEYAGDEAAEPSSLGLRHSLGSSPGTSHGRQGKDEEVRRRRRHRGAAATFAGADDNGGVGYVDVDMDLDGARKIGAAADDGSSTCSSSDSQASSALLSVGGKGAGGSQQSPSSRSLLDPTESLSTLSASDAAEQRAAVAEAAGGAGAGGGAGGHREASSASSSRGTPAAEATEEQLETEAVVASLRERCHWLEQRLLHKEEEVAALQLQLVRALSARPSSSGPPLPFLPPHQQHQQQHHHPDASSVTPAHAAAALQDVSGAGGRQGPSEHAAAEERVDSVSRGGASGDEAPPPGIGSSGSASGSAAAAAAAAGHGGKFSSVGGGSRGAGGGAGLPRRSMSIDGSARPSRGGAGAGAGSGSSAAAAAELAAAAAAVAVSDAASTRNSGGGGPSASPGPPLASPFARSLSTSASASASASAVAAPAGSGRAAYEVAAQGSLSYRNAAAVGNARGSQAGGGGSAPLYAHVPSAPRGGAAAAAAAAAGGGGAHLGHSSRSRSPPTTVALSPEYDPSQASSGVTGDPSPPVPAGTALANGVAGGELALHSKQHQQQQQQLEKAAQQPQQHGKEQQQQQHQQVGSITFGSITKDLLQPQLQPPQRDVQAEQQQQQQHSQATAVGHFMPVRRHAQAAALGGGMDASGGMQEDFPHLALINDLLDEDLGGLGLGLGLAASSSSLGTAGAEAAAAAAAAAAADAYQRAKYGASAGASRGGGYDAIAAAGAQGEAPGEQRASLQQSMHHHNGGGGGGAPQHYWAPAGAQLGGQPGISNGTTPPSSVGHQQQLGHGLADGIPTPQKGAAMYPQHMQQQQRPHDGSLANGSFSAAGYAPPGRNGYVAYNAQQRQ